MTTNAHIEEQTKKLYEDIHPFVDVEYAINNYLSTTGLGPDFFKDKDVLDCGFGGTGWALELFARSGVRHLAGIDLNERWRDLNIKRLERYTCKKDIRAGSVLNLPFEDNSFDYVHSNGVLHHTTDWKKGASEMARVLRPGGTMFLMLYGKFAPVGALIHGTYRFLGKVIPYTWTSAFVKKTGFLRHSEISLLDAMYVPIEDHLSEKEIFDHLQSLGLENPRWFESLKWKNHPVLSHPLLFGRKLQHNILADKPKR
jgi:ubiquinone/menaquinone biosynthesis C-methylase UbiE